MIDAEARDGIAAHVEAARRDGRLLKQLSAPQTGTFIGPAVIRVPGIAAMEREIFGPVLHVATFKAGQVAQVIKDINATGYGLTFGLHTRIDDRVQEVISALQVGNAYVNRNQIGAVVGSQPFGGEGLSGTGPKAGGPDYLHRFTAQPAPVNGNPAPPRHWPKPPAGLPPPRQHPRPSRWTCPAPLANRTACTSPPARPSSALAPAPRRPWRRPKRSAALAAAPSKPRPHPEALETLPVSPARSGGAMPQRPGPMPRPWRAATGRSCR